ncbi:MAG: hypothetical protein AAF226_00370, partial [Verrucomicrobiota bacterium]
VMPVVYYLIFDYLKRKQHRGLTKVAYFCLCGIVGGWAFAFAMAPSGLAAIAILINVFGGGFAAFVFAAFFAFQKKRRRAETIVVACSIGYVFLLVALLLIPSLTA